MKARAVISSTATADGCWPTVMALITDALGARARNPACYLYADQQGRHHDLL